MKLHEAITKLLEVNGNYLTINEIAEKLNSNNWYKKKDNSVITAYQIHGRTKNYAHLFKRDGIKVSLHIPDSTLLKSFVISKAPTIAIKKPIINTYNISVVEKYLMNDIYFKPVNLIDGLVPVNECGLYRIRIDNIDSFPDPFKEILIKKNHKILYVGIAKKCLNTRLLNQELRIKGHGTFIRSIGGILGFRPLQGSLVNKKNKTNYTFIDTDNQKIVDWINKNLSVNWISFRGDLEKVETTLIDTYNPLLNISKNRLALSELKNLRSLCRNIANS